MLVTFEEVKIYAEKSGKCLCGKRRKRTTYFSQTLNPWNKNKKTGELKSRSEILDELYIKRDEWQKEQITCDYCYDAYRDSLKEKKDV
jgi:hypothetical protein